MDRSSKEVIQENITNLKEFNGRYADALERHKCFNRYQKTLADDAKNDMPS
ncbi:MAG: hypothetical protein ACI9TY_001630 [Alphaproteobacteria bacterium]|jgi:hypothetical protein